MTKNILVIGSGGREHALCWRLAQSPQAGRLFCAPGNPGIAELAECVALAGVPEIIAFCRAQEIALVVIGPEQPLVEGLADQLTHAKIPVFGPSAKAAQLEGSKAFTKALCLRHNIPTAAYAEFTEVEAAKDYVRRMGAPIVLKADGLAAGKGVIVAQTLDEALAAVDTLLGSWPSIVIEEFLQGVEASFFALSDGQTAIEFASAQDHKRAYDNDQGPNTGGMGAFSPALPEVLPPELRERVMREIILPTVQAMRDEGYPFKGVLFAGLMIKNGEAKLLEYNARFGDPETQAMLLRLDSDLVALLEACVYGGLAAQRVELSEEKAICVVMAAKGYPGEYAKGSMIRSIEKAEAVAGVTVFHAGTAQAGAEIVSNGGRVLGVCARDATFAGARERAYQAVRAIDWQQGFYRSDIGGK